MRSPDPALCTPRWWPDSLVLVLVGLLLVMVRLTGLPSLMDNDQYLPAAYAVDIVHHGAWVVQRDDRGNIASKPPMYQWVVAAAGLASGTGVNAVTLALPSVIGMLGCALLVYGVGTAVFGRAAGFAGAIALLISPFGVKYIALYRVDALFALGCFAAMLLAWRASETGRGWVLFWIMCGAAALTKTPIVVPLALSGILAWFWLSPGERPRGTLLRRSHIIGITCFLVMTCGWLALAYAEYGQPVIDKLFGDELVGHAIGKGENHYFGKGFVRAPVHFVARFLPWSVLVLVAMWRVLRQPDTDARSKRFERVLFCTIVFGLLAFGTAAKPRPDHLLPLIPLASLLAGRELMRWVGAWPAARLRLGVALAVLVGALGTGLHYHVLYASNPRVQLTVGMYELAELVESLDWSGCLGSGRVLTVDAPFAFSYAFGSYERISLDEAARIICENRAGVAIVVRDMQRLRAMLAELGCEAEWPVVLEWEDGSGSGVRVVSGCARRM